MDEFIAGARDDGMIDLVEATVLIVERSQCYLLCHRIRLEFYMVPRDITERHVDEIVGGPTDKLLATLQREVELHVALYPLLLLFV